MKVIAMVVMLAAPIAASADEKSLCTDYAEVIISGRPVSCGFMQACSADELMEKAREKGYSCEPLAQYLEIAKMRLELKAIQAANAPAQQRAFTPPPMLNQYQQIQPRPTTHCRQVGDEVQCRTY